MTYGVPVFDLNHYTATLLDMDGVLYRGQMPLPGVNEMLALFERRGIAYACVTNNSTLTPEQYEAKLAAMGIAIPAARVITSSVATRRYLEGQAPRGTPAYYIGEKGLYASAGAARGRPARVGSSAQAHARRQTA